MNGTESIGMRVRTLREERGYSQEQLAEVLGLNKSAISRVESGQRGLAVQELAAVAPFLGVSVEEVMFGKSEDTLVRLRGEGDVGEAAAYAERVINDFEYLSALGA